MCEKILCAGCGDDGTNAQFKVFFIDGEILDVCNICIKEYFEEIPNEIEKVESTVVKELYEEGG